MGTELAASWRTASELVQQFPQNLAFRTALALSLYRQRDFAGALQAYAGLAIDWSQALPNQRAVYAAVLAANDKSSEARQLVHELVPTGLRPEELRLLDSLRKK